MTRLSKTYCAITIGAMIAGAPFSSARAGEAPAPVAADSAGEVELEPVTVTVRRRTENAQDIPAAISVVSGHELEAQRLYQVQDLQQALPNLTSQFLHARQSSLSVRGIGNNTANEGLEGSVGIYLDNVFLGRPGQAVFDLLDVEQIELLRGPQGTLFGKNTSAGVLNISTRQPGFEPDASVEVSLGSRNYRQLKGFYSGPLSDTVAFRVSVSGTHDDGWVKNIQNGKRYNEIDRRGVRGQLLIEPDASFSLRLIAEHNQERSSTGTLVPYSYGPLTRPGFATAANFTNYAQWATLLGARAVVSTPDRYEISQDGDQRADVRQNALSAEANWTLPAGHRLTSITAWRDWRFDPKNDLDGTSLPAVTGGFNAEENQFSQEFRLASPSGGAYDYVLGTYFYRQRTTSRNHYQTGPTAFLLYGFSFPNSNMASGYGKADTDSAAVFGQGTLHLSPALDLTGGLRFTSERKQGRVIQYGLARPDPVLSAIPLSRYWDSGTLSRNDDSLAGMIAASYRFTPQLLGYASYSRGEKSGGYNVNSVASPGSAFGVGAITIAPEKAENLELGIKSSWLEKRLQLNANLFLTKIRDYQAITNLQYAPTNTYLAVLTNVGDLTSKGVEFDLKAQATSRLGLSLNGAYTLARFNSGTAPTPYEIFDGTYGGGSRSISGNRVNGAPKWTVNASGQYRLSYRNGVEQYFNASYAWRSETYGDVNNSRYSQIPAYGLLNLATGWRVARDTTGSWDLSLWVRNVFDKAHYLGLATAGNNHYQASVGQPRTVGVSLRYDFF